MREADQLQGIGFNKLGESPLFRRNNFLVSVDSNGNYQFFTDYFNHLGLNMVKGIKITNGESTVFKGSSNLFVVYQYPNGAVGVHEAVLGGSGRFGPADNPNVLDEFNRPLNLQLVETGFTPVDEEAGVYHAVFDDEHYGKTDIYVVLEDGSIKRIVTPVLKSYPERERGRKFVKDLGVTLTGFETRRETSSQYDSDAREFKEQEIVHDVLTARNSAMELAFFADGGFMITKLLRDIEPEELGVIPLEAKVESTGFVVGGVNPTELIRTLLSLNGIPIEQLEGGMRGRDISDIDFSKDPFGGIFNDLPEPDETVKKQIEDFRKKSETSGSFLGRNESLRDVLAEDNDYILGLGLTHQELGRMIRYTTALSQVLGLGRFTYKGRTYSTSWLMSLGYQESPFADGTRCSSDFGITNENTGAKFYTSTLHGDIIERYGFYAGKGVGYRLEPRDIVEVFDFLKEEGQQRLAKNSQG